MDAFDAEMPERDRRVTAELALEIEIPLLSTRIAEVAGEREQTRGPIRDWNFRENIWIRDRKYAARICEGLYLNSILRESSAGEDGGRDGVENTIAAANYRFGILARRVSKTESRRDIGGIDMNAIGANIHRRK
jgi:hypothetical protein